MTAASRIVVGVDGSPASWRALEWAAAEAARRHVSLHAVHAGWNAPTPRLSAETAGAVARESCNYGEELLDETTTHLVEDWPDVEFSTELRPEDPADVLVELSWSAEVVVVGTHARSEISRLIFGSTAQRVANEAHCPVVLVPDMAPVENATQVAVGASPTPNGARAMDFACAEAALRGVGVIALRSWPDVSWNTRDGLGFSLDMSLGAIEAAATAQLGRIVEEARQRHPDVTITPKVVATPAEIALCDVEGAALVVVGCRRTESSHLSRMGSITSWVASHARCPVVVVGQTAARSEGEPSERTAPEFAEQSS